ncbi:MAG: hypothetical protein IKQ24_08675 [Verrucomicrobia bacterium]|nr:hypothetical protein [Verrucomicrobiota bacterium]
MGLARFPYFPMHEQSFRSPSRPEALQQTLESVGNTTKASLAYAKTPLRRVKKRRQTNKSKLCLRLKPFSELKKA